jgi:GTP cyclohydrolase II
MPDPLHWLGVTRIDKFISMSDMKYDAIVSSGIEIIDRIDIPDELIPPDAKASTHDSSRCLQMPPDAKARPPPSAHDGL